MFSPLPLYRTETTGLAEDKATVFLKKQLEPVKTCIIKATAFHKTKKCALKIPEDSSYKSVASTFKRSSCGYYSTFVLEHTPRWLVGQEQLAAKCSLRWRWELNREMELFGIVLAGDEKHLHKAVILLRSLKAALRISACLTWGTLLSKPGISQSFLSPSQIRRYTWWHRSNHLRGPRKSTGVEPPTCSKFIHRKRCKVNTLVKSL